MLSPCVTYYDTHREWRARVYNVDEDESFDPTDRTGTFQRLLELKDQGQIPIGRIYKGEHPSLESIIVNKDEIFPAQQEIGHDDHRKHYEQFMKAHLG